MVEKIVPDTSVIISGRLSEAVETGELKKIEVIIPEFVVEELRAQASRGREIGFKGLEELTKMRQLSQKKKLVLVKTGRRQTKEEIDLAKYGRIDALIVDVARDEKATLYTSDMVQAKVAEAEGVKTKYFEPYKKKKETILDTLLSKDAMSLHLKDGTVPMIKKGKPGNFKLSRIRKKPMELEELEEIIKEVNDAARYEEDSYVEENGHTASIVQLNDKRIAITRPPFSDKTEVTVVRPITKLRLEDYKLSQKLKDRLENKAEGILLSGPPGSGKSTLAASIADFYEEKGKIVKTMESPRDLQVKPEVTQYSKLRGSFENTADMLLLVRPDYTIFDEVRKTNDFHVFSDMRLSGVGMIGVVHATDPVDSIQRFIGRVELGIIPHVIDTILYVNAGKIEKVYYLKLVVRTPTGMNEADLARPVVEVRNFETEKLEYEIYTYGEENVIIPVTEGHSESAIKNLAKMFILDEIRRFDRNADVEIVSDDKAVVYVENDLVPRLIGKKGKHIQQFEEKLGIKIDVTPRTASIGKRVDFDADDTGAYIVFNFDKNLFGEIGNFYVSGEYVFSATVGKTGQIKVSKDSEIGDKIMKGLLKNQIKVFI